MSTFQTGQNNGMWRGGRTVTQHGYILIRVGKAHSLADCRGYAYEHRLVMEAKLGRKLLPGEKIHHLNGNKQDNRPENLRVVNSNSEHFLLHRHVGLTNRKPGEDNPVIQCGCGCGMSFAKYDNNGRPRRFISGHNAKVRI